MIEIYKIDKYEVENWGYGFWIWIGTLEDMYFSTKELAFKYNPKRTKRLQIELTFIKWKLEIRIPYKHIGWNFRGKDRNPELKVKK